MRLDVADSVADPVLSLVEKSTRQQPPGNFESNVRIDCRPTPSISGETDSNEGDSDDEDPEDEAVEVVKLCLSLITGLLVDELDSPDDLQLMLTVEPHVEWIANKGPSSVQHLAQRTLKALKDPHDILSGAFDDRPSESAESFKNAVAALDDPIVPIRAHALHVIRQLVLQKDPVVSFEAGLKIYLSQLADSDSFIYLNAIKGLEALAETFTYKKVLPAVLGFYADHENSLDERLRAGEAVERLIERNDRALDAESTTALAEILITIVSRRSGVTSQDNRMRMSAMSLLASVSKLNPLALGPYLGDVVDVAVGVLTFETGNDDDSTIMRRSAVFLLASLAEGLPSLDEFPSGAVRTVMTRLRAVYETDSDPLARSQAGSALSIVQSRLTGN
jgi:hypothetical protein